jgi:DNA invertase Pin-like site-specific DNA recombinase
VRSRSIALSNLAFCGEPHNAEFERDLIRERTSAGRADARRRRIQFGRPRKLSPEQAKLARPLIDEGKSVREVAENFKVHAATIYHVV